MNLCLKSIKAGSFVCFNISKFKCKTEFDEEHDKHEFSTSVNGKQKRITALDKPFVCGTCHKGFALKCNLKKHQRVHTGDSLKNVRSVIKNLLERTTWHNISVFTLEKNLMNVKHVISDSHIP